MAEDQPETHDQLRARIQLQHKYRTNEKKRRGDCACGFFWEVRRDIPRTTATERLTRCMMGHVESAILEEVKRRS